MRLTRTATEIYFECDGAIDAAAYQLALAGIRAVPGDAAPDPAAGLRPAIALDLVPVVGIPEAIDIVELRPIPLSEASAVLMRRRIRWLGASRAGRDACLRLLRDEDAVVGWRRIVWCSVAALRSARQRVRLRPVVFDRGAIERHPFQWSYASKGAVERWAFP